MPALRASAPCPAAVAGVAPVGTRLAEAQGRRYGRYHADTNQPLLPMDLLPEGPLRRRVLREIEDRILAETGNQRERLVLLDTSGTVVFSKTGTREGIVLTAAELARWRGRADLATHNHPLGFPFSRDDVLTAIHLDVREVHAFTLQIRYRLGRAAGSQWPDADTFARAVADLEDRAQAVVRAAVTGRDTGATAADVVALYRHLLWTALARRLNGVHYALEERDGDQA